MHCAWVASGGNKGRHLGAPCTFLEHVIHQSGNPPWKPGARRIAAHTWTPYAVTEEPLEKLRTKAWSLRACRTIGHGETSNHGTAAENPLGDQHARECISQIWPLWWRPCKLCLTCVCLLGKAMKQLQRVQWISILPDNACQGLDSYYSTDPAEPPIDEATETRQASSQTSRGTLDPRRWKWPCKTAWSGHMSSTTVTCSRRHCNSGEIKQKSLRVRDLQVGCGTTPHLSYARSWRSRNPRLVSVPNAGNSSNDTFQSPAINLGPMDRNPTLSITACNRASLWVSLDG